MAPDIKYRVAGCHDALEDVFNVHGARSMLWANMLA
jgi:hypothetical protein